MRNNSRAAMARGSALLIVRLWRATPALASVWLGLPLLLGATLLPYYAAQRDLVDVAAGGPAERAWAETLAAVWPPLAVLTGAALLRAVFGALHEAVDAKLRDAAAMRIQADVHERALRVPLAAMDRADYYDRLQRAKEAAGGDLLGVLQQTILFVRQLFEWLGLAAAAAAADPVAGAVLAAVFLVSLAIRLESDIVKRRLNRDLTGPGRRSDYLRDEIAKPATVKEMRLYGTIYRLIGTWRDDMRQSLAMRMNANRREIRHGIAASAVQIAGLFGTVAWMAAHLKSGAMTAGAFVVVFQAMRQANGLSARMAFPLGKLYIQSAKLLDLTEFLRLPPESPADGADAASAATPAARRPAPGPLGRIAFEDVTFRYAGAAEPALRDIRLTLEPGETVALVGGNGAGKSTLVKLLLGLYRPTAGRVAWDGVGLDELDPALVRRAMSAAFQDFVRYETTVRDNVAFGRPDAAGDDAVIRRALRAGGADALERLPGGLDARLGLLGEGGRELSGGEWQRLAVARAALRDARLLVLDEPTAALDPQHETALYRSFRELARGRTALFVSHRLGWARYADRIVVLRDGTIAEEGTHESLLAANGVYAAMFREQADWYRGGAPV
ncbi:ABC transporter ATP-binding protein [Paenibacillus flagellatus]|uniref:ABC transporter ATP-binding protein n=1 Tax=Paenibacillus flagellatus TaxID=2211139 RepID=A0A2V5K803_9BACL|nr:ABC transporter ATP-binding protein [Paenibacillus flagellatus]PYI53973.1 ABC transporter ATP-binding protein [Paenibacillus flagellatus]